MERTDDNFPVKFNTRFFFRCVSLPVIFFIITLLLSAVFSVGGVNKVLIQRSLQEFLSYYERNAVREFFIIALNNSFIALVMIYFTPFALFVRRFWEKQRNSKVLLSTRETLLLYSFPAIFLVREAIRIALTVNDLSGQIHKGVILTFFGIIFPHGLPELLALGIAGAIGMEVTRSYIFCQSGGKTPGLRTLSLVIIFVSLCAFLEVRFTPRVFALLVTSGV